MKKIQLFLKYLVLMLFLTVWIIIMFFKMCIRDSDNTAPLIKTAMRELHEETGLKVIEKDTVSVINPCLFSTPVSYTHLSVYPNSVLGGDRELLESCKDGDIPFVVQNTAPQVTFMKDTAVFDMQMCIRDRVKIT